MSLGPFQITLIRWIVGLTVSLRLGHIVTNDLVHRLRKNIKGEQKRSKVNGPPIESLVAKERLAIENWQVGLLERPFFTVLVALEISGTAVAMMGSTDGSGGFCAQEPS